MITLGCIADDFTGGTDVAAALRRSGLTVALLFEVPGPAAEVPVADAVVIALKTRTVEAAEAVRQSLAALSWLQERDTQRFYFKYCSTFDSTPAGNIGPVADALLEELGEDTTLVCPASPEHGRTTYLGHLFVHDELLSESPMRNHPLTPMTDSKITRVLGRQTDGSVALLPLASIQAGPDEVSRRLKELADEHVRYVVVDAISEPDLGAIARGASSLRLLTGGAGLAGAWATVLVGRLERDDTPAQSQLPVGPSVVLAGSCSAATLGQVAEAVSIMPSLRLDPARTPSPESMLAQARQWLKENLQPGPVLIYSSAEPEQQQTARATLGPDAAEIFEHTLSALAVEAVRLGARRLVVAGGETSGAVVQALDVHSVVVDSEEARGVPWCVTPGVDPLALLLKSGNFGDRDLLVRASARRNL